MDARARIRVLLPGLAFGGGLLARARDSEVVRALDPIRTRHRVPALGAALVTGRGVITQGVVGVRKAGTNVPATIADKGHLGSNTKAMTAVLLARLIERGKLDWETTLEKIFPDLAPAFPQDFRNITVTHLLSHRAGLPGTPDWTDYEEVIRTFQSLPRQRLELMKKTAARGVGSPPGERYQYSSAGYMIAGAVAERLTGRAWEDLLRDMVFKPLGMNGCGFGGTGTLGKIDQPWPHTVSGEATPTNGPAVDNPRILAPAGSVHCSLGDWAKFIADALRGEPALLKRDSYRRLHLSQGDDCALGWFVVSGEAWADGIALQHYGTNRKNFALVRMAPRRGFAVLAVTNRGGDEAKSALDDASAALVQLYDSRR
ncbi:MAG: beta-lactamase family protein [Acidobacteria bacterium]|nr:beta-lactamase family protein [Acidobacteriota bacterium]